LYTQSGSRRRAGLSLWRAAEAELLPQSKTSRNFQAAFRGTATVLFITFHPLLSHRDKNHFMSASTF
jgi:hypothetical protein